MKEIKSFKDLLDLFEEMYGDLNTPKQSCDNNCKKHKETPVTNNTNVELTKDVTMLNEDSYLLTNKVNGIKISENTKIVFGHEDNGFVVPGITEDQILCMLLYRNRNKKERYDLIKQLLNTK